MKTLTIIPQRHETAFKLTGLSYKAMGMDAQDLYKNDLGQYCIENEFRLNPKTANISKEKLIEFVSLIHENIPFDRIKIEGHFEATGEEIMNQIKQPKQ